MDSETILIVEDDAIAARYAALVLKERFTVVCAATVREACVALEQVRPLVAVTIDGKLPDGSGKTVLSQVRDIRPEISILVMTGNPDDHDLANLAQSVGAEYAIKPGGSIVGFGRRVLARMHLKDIALIRRTSIAATKAELTLCETEVLTLGVAGRSRDQIAKLRGVSLETIKSQCAAIGTKFGRPFGDVAWRIQSGDRAEHSSSGEFGRAEPGAFAQGPTSAKGSR